MPAGFEADTEHLYFRDMLFLRPVLTLFSRLIILELAEVHDLNDWRIRGRRDLNDVEPALLGNTERLFKRYLAEVFAGFINGADTFGADLIVDTVASEDNEYWLVRLRLVPRNGSGNCGGSQRHRRRGELPITLALRANGRRGEFCSSKISRAPSAQAKFLPRSPGFLKRKAVCVFGIPFNSRSSSYTK